MWLFVVFCVFGAETAVVHEDVPISATPITLIVKSRCRLARTPRPILTYSTVILLKVHTIVSQALLVDTREPCIIHDGKLISTGSVTPIGDVTRIKSPLHRCDGGIRLGFAWEVHLPCYKIN